MDTTSKEESEPMEPEIQALQDEASGSIDVDDEDEMEELHNSLKEVVKDPSVKPKLQCLMVDPSFSMVTVQSEDSGIVWETASSRCSTPWASEGSSPSESYGLESSAAQGKITVIMDDNKIVRKRKKSGRSKLGDRIKRPSSRMAAYGTERPAMTEVSVPNVKPENDEPAELKVDKDQELFSLISEGYEILNIVVPSKLPTVDEEEAGDLVDNLSYLQDTPKIKSKSKLAPVPAGDDYQGIIVQEIINGEKEEADKITETGMKDAKKEGPDEDYLDKFKLVDSHALSEQSSSSGVPNEENIMQEPEQVKPQGELKSSPSNIEDSFVIITDNEIASEHMDEVFYANTGTMADEKNKGHDSDRKVKDEPRSLKESGSALFGSQETILIPVYLPEGPPKIIDQVLLEEPRAMSFLYTDLYDEAMGSRRRDDDHSDVESTVSEKSYKKRFSDDDEEDEGYLEKFILKDETPVVQEPLEVADDVREGGRIIWPQNKFELTGCLKRVKEEDDSGGEKTEIAATEQMEDSEKAQPVDTGKPEEISQGPITKAADGSKIEQEKEDDTEVCVGNHCEPCVAGKMIPESPESVIQNDASNLLLEERAETVEEIGKHDGEIAATEQMEDSEKAQPVDTGKPEEISQGPITKAADESKIEQEKEDDTEVCVGNHCEPCDAGKMIPESPESVIQNDISNLLLEERAETVEEIRKHDAISEKAKDSKETESEMMGISGTVSKKSPDLLNEGEQTASEKAINTIQEPETSLDMKTSSPEEVSEKLTETTTIVEEPSCKKLEGVAEIQSDVKISTEPINEAIEVKKSDEIEADQATPDTTSQVKVEETITKEKPAAPLVESDVIATAPEAMKDSKVSVVSEEQLTDSVSEIPDEVAGGSKEPNTDTIPEGKTENATVPADVIHLEDVSKSLPEVETEVLKQDSTEQEGATDTLLDEKSVAITETEMASIESPGVEVLTVEDTAARTPSPSAAPAPIEVQEVTTEDRKEGEPVEEQAEEPEGLLFSTLRSFSPKEDLSVLPEPEALKEYRDEMAEELDYEMITQQEAREYPGVEAEVIPEREEEECFTEVDTSKALEEEAAEDVLEADYEFIEESESVELSEEDQAKMQALDAFCLVCQCPVLMMEEHQNHEVCSLDRAYELLKDRLSNWISTLQERSENIEDMVSEIELVYNSVEEQCKMNEEAMDDQNEEMLRLVMDQYNEMSHTMEEEKKAKLEKLYDQIVSFQESIDIAKETLEKNSKEEEEEEEDSFTFVSSSKDINMSLTKALESTMSLELGPRGLSVFDDYAKGSGNGQKHRKGIPVPQKPHLQPQEANSATSTSVTVYWKVNEGDIIDCFQVYCMEDPQGAISEEYRVTVKESYCTLEELDPDKCYKVWVMAVNYTGCSLPSERLSFKTAPSVPVIQPERCTVLWDSATLRWASEQPSAAESYTLEYCRQYACEGEGLRSFSGIQGCEQRVLLQPNENYLLYIKAVNSAGASEQSEAALISTRGTRFQLMKETAGPALRLLEDKTTVLYSQDSFSEMASINECPAILGELLPLKGYYYWETVVSGCPSYRLGVAYSSNPSDSLLGENSTSWCLHCVPTSSSSRFELLHNSVETDIFVVDVPTRVGTLLDFAQGRLVFINAQNGHLLGSTQHRFTEPCHAAFGLESPGCLTVHMLPEVPESARHC
ncbi:cardiomyopathy-associated protein 5 isoform X5 [Alosa sapidissima]|uniref:cardiomyopathy-associated protein 5 isoform X5 n=1 Tax=Alosa sapidissima TaxID=34773 RepID=UPI001C08061A|nr:cardiomyopathy-associated protein 5 isoform X5 [Alosa sapidissima]